MPTTTSFLCYNMFPYMFQDISAMEAYLDTVQKMGFNTVWLNPIQDSTNQYPVDNDEELESFYLMRRSTLTGFKKKFTRDSVYAMMDSENLHPDLFNGLAVDEEEKKNLLKRFISAAKDRGIKVLFDLVLLHVSKYSPLVQDYPNWFCPEDPNAVSEEDNFSDTRRFNYNNDEYLHEIINFWKNFIKRYMVDYGFSGVRVDCAQAIDFSVRNTIYSFIFELNAEAIIFDETLFSHIDISDYAAFAQQKLTVKPAYITGSAYFLEPDAFGAFPRLYPFGGEGWVSYEDYHKSTIVAEGGGVANFTGNHDRLSATMRVLQRMSLQHLSLMAEKFNPEIMNKWRNKINDFLSSPDSALRQAKLLTILSPVRDELLQHIKSEKRNVYKEEFIATYIAHFANMAFTGSGGYYMLSGDEVMSLITPSVFRKGELLPPTSDIEKFLSNPEIEIDLFKKATKLVFNIDSSQLVRYVRAIKNNFQIKFFKFPQKEIMSKFRELSSSVKLSSLLRDFYKDVAKGCDLCSMAELPDDNLDNAKIDKLYLSDDGSYFFRDTTRKIQKGKLNIDNIDLVNLSDKLKDPIFKKNILNAVLESGHIVAEDMSTYLKVSPFTSYLIEKLVYTVREQLIDINSYEEIENRVFGVDTLKKVLEFEFDDIVYLIEAFKRTISAFLNKKTEEILSEYREYNNILSKNATDHLKAQILDTATEAARLNKLTIIKNLNIEQYVPPFYKQDKQRVCEVIERALFNIGEKNLAKKKSIMNIEEFQLLASVSRDLISPDFVSKYISYINTTLGALPKTKLGFWSESFKTEENDLIIVRVNGSLHEENRRVDLIILNLHPWCSCEVGLNFIVHPQNQPAKKDESLAEWFTSRLFVNSKDSIEAKKAYALLDPKRNFNLHVWLGPAIFCVEELQKMLGERIHLYGQDNQEYGEIEELRETTSTTGFVPQSLANRPLPFNTQRPQ